MHLVHNEKIKLTSFNLNLVGAGSLLAGLVVFVMDSATRSEFRLRELFVAMAFVCIGLVLHMMGRVVLNGLRE